MATGFISILMCFYTLIVCIIISYFHIYEDTATSLEMEFHHDVSYYVIWYYVMTSCNVLLLVGCDCSMHGIAACTPIAACLPLQHARKWCSFSCPPYYQIWESDGDGRFGGGSTTEPLVSSNQWSFPLEKIIKLLLVKPYSILMGFFYHYAPSTAKSAFSRPNQRPNYTFVMLPTKSRFYSMMILNPRFHLTCMIGL